MILILILGIAFIGCQFSSKNEGSGEMPNTVHVVGALKNVMQKGELQGRILLDTITNRKGLYGLGPEAYLTGELLIYNGESYVSRVQPDSSIRVDLTFEASAPFLVYANVDAWKEVDLPFEVGSMQELQQHLEKYASVKEKAFPYRLSGTVKSAVFHIQNLPEGTTVSSPEEAHQGQVNYEIRDEEVRILGFFSKQHQGIFTHHDSYLHMHLISTDEGKMGHLDRLEIGSMKLYLPAE